MAARRKEEVDAARHRQEKREATRLGNLLSQTEEGGGMLPDFFFSSLFPLQQTTSGIGHRVK